MCVWVCVHGCACVCVNVRERESFWKSPKKKKKSSKQMGLNRDGFETSHKFLARKNIEMEFETTPSKLICSYDKKDYSLFIV